MIIGSDFVEAKKIAAKFGGLKELDNYFVQYQLLLDKSVLRAHVDGDGNATVVFDAKKSPKSVLANAKGFKAKILKEEKISYDSLLSKTFNK